MDKYEYRIRAEEINALIDKKEYVEAVKIADTIDWRRVKSVMMLCKISELYKINRRYEESKEILLLAYDRNPGSRKIVYSLCELAIKLEETVQAVEYYKEFVQIAPRDTGKFILQYRLYEAQDVSLEERIAVLEEYKKRDYREKWAYELAYLYHRIGLATRCVEECDELILWFGEGKYVIKAMELKMLHCPLTASQQEKYDRRFEKEEPVNESSQEAPEENNSEESELPIEIKAVEPSDGPTAKIPSKDVEAELMEQEAEEESEQTQQEDENENLNEASEEEEETQVEEETEEETEIPEETKEDSDEKDEIPLTPPDDDLDIKVKTIDVDNEYSTINLQQELAKSLAKFMAEEDMVASDATLAMPFATLAEAATSDTIMGAITDDSIKNAIIAPLLQDTTELTPITEEDLLASMKENEENQPEQEVAQEPVQPQAATPIQESVEPEPEQSMQEQAEEPEQPEQSVQEQAEEPEQPEQSVQEQAEAPEQPEQSVQEQAEAPEQPEQSVQEQAEASVQEAVELVQPIQPQAEAPVQEAARPDFVTEEEVSKPNQIEAAEISNQPEQSLQESAPETLQQSSEPEQKPDDEQITGQLSLEDIMAEWEQTKKANEERRIKEMRERVIQQTGPMFSNFDAMARASVQADLDLISPAVDVFKHAYQEEEPEQETFEESADDLDNNLVEEPTIEEIEKDTESNNVQQEREKAPSTTFNTEEIFGLEEKLLSVLDSPEMKEEAAPIEPISIDSSFFEDNKQEENQGEPIQPELLAAETEVQPEEDTVQEPTETKKPAEIEIQQPIVKNLTEIQPQQPAAEEKPTVIPVSQDTIVIKDLAEIRTHQPAMAVNPITAEPQEPVKEEPIKQQVSQDAIVVEDLAEAWSQPPTEKPADNQLREPTAAEKPMEAWSWQQPMAAESPMEVQPQQPAMPNVPETVQPQTAAEAVAAMKSQIPAVSMEAPVMSQPQTAAEAVAAMKARTSAIPKMPEIEQPQQRAIEPAAEAIQELKPQSGVSIGEPVDLKSTDYIQAFMPENESQARPLTKEEKVRFASFAPNKKEQNKVARALDSMALSASVGNMLITGEPGTGTIQAAQNAIAELKEKNPEFSGKAAKITGALLAEKNIGATLESLENSALIIEQVGSMPADALGSLLFHLDRLKDHKIFVIMEDTKNEMERLALLYPEIALKFNSRMDIEALDNDGLVNYAKEYAKQQEYAIDDMGILALYTKISDMQTNEHAVTVSEVKEMIDKAIVHAGKKNMSHFMDIILAKRYDGDDMIILREKDFLN